MIYARILLRVSSNFLLLLWNVTTRIPTKSQCVKIAKKVAFNIASEASYIYILSGQKFIKNAKKANFGEFLKTQFKCDILSKFQTLCKVVFMFLFP